MIIQRVIRPLLAGLAMLAFPAAAPAQPRAIPHVYALPSEPSGAAPWALPHDDRRATIVTGLDAPRRYRVCNESNTTAVIITDVSPAGFDLPARSCVDVAAKTITVGQRVIGIPPRGSFLRLD